MFDQVISIVTILSFIVSSIGANDQDWELTIEHILNENEPFTKKGTVSLVKNVKYAGFFSNENRLIPDEFRRNLLVASQRNDLYRVRMAHRWTSSEDHGGFVSSFAHPCQLLRSNMSEMLLISVDSRAKAVLSVTIQPVIVGTFDHSPCSQMDVDFVRNTQFNITVVVHDVEDGPSPDTRSFIKKLEKEKQFRQHGAEQDNRSFLAKYWVYIIPVVVFMLMSGVMNQEGQQRQGANS